MDSCKFLWHYDRVKKYYLEGERIAPVHIDIGIAKFCQIDCVFCFGNFQDKSKEYIERDALIQTMKDAGDIGVRSIGLIGDGEPTCNPAWQEALYAGREAGVDMGMSSSTVAINTDEKARAVTDNCTWVRTCLGAGTREGYKVVHRRDYFDKVVANIERLVRVKENTHSKCTLGIQSVFVPMFVPGETLALAKLAVDLGVDYFLVKQCSLPDEGQSGMLQFSLDDYDKPEVVDELKAVEECSNDKTQCIVKWNIMARKGERDYDGCPAVPLLSEMSGNGDWYPCGYFFGDKPQYDKYKFGNVHEKSLKEIWRSDRYMQILEAMKNDFDNRTQCKGCCRLDVNNSAVWAWEQARKNYKVLGLDGSYIDANIRCELLCQGDIPHRNFI